MENENMRPKFSLTVANHWSYTGIGWQLGLESCVQSVTDSMEMSDYDPSVKICINLDARAYELIAEYFPYVTKKLKKYLDAGKVELIGGSYGQPMASMIGNESNIRQLVLGRKAIEDAVDGYEITSFLEEEEFTYPQLPQLLANTGFRYVSLAQCDTWGKTGAPSMKKSHVIWQSPDGSEMPCAAKTKLYFHPPVVTKDVDFLQTPEGQNLIEEADEANPLAVVWTEFGWEPKGGMQINKFDPMNYKKLSQKYDVEYVTLSQYMEKNSSPDDEKVVLGYHDFHKLLPWGVGADQLRVNDRRIESALLSAEKLDVIAACLTLNTQKEQITKAWKELLISQSHDVSLCEYTRWGGGIMPDPNMVLNTHSLPWGSLGYRHLDNADQLTRQVLRTVVTEISKQIDTETDASGEYAVTVFNTCEWDRMEYVKTDMIYFESAVSGAELFDADGTNIACHVIQSEQDAENKYHYIQLGFTAVVPAMGYNTYYIKTTTGKTAAASDERKLLSVQDDCFVMENIYLSAKISRTKGALISLICKETGEETLDTSTFSPKFRGQPSHQYPVWAQDANLPEYNSLADDDKITVKAEQNHSTIAQIVVRYTLDSLILELIYTLTEASRGIDIKSRLVAHVPPKAAYGNINGWQLPLEIKDGYWLDFTHGLKNPKLYGDQIFISEELKREDVHVSTYLDIVGDKTGLLITHAGTQYFHLEGNKVSNLILREWESHFTKQCGWPEYSECGYLLTPHRSSMSPAEKLKISRSFDGGIFTSCEEIHGGRLDKCKSFARLESENALVSSLRSTEEGVELRLFETDGKDAEAVFHNTLGLTSGHETDMLGNLLPEEKTQNLDKKIPVKPWKIKTLKLSGGENTL